MINKAIKFLQEKPKLYLNTYEHILIDEYQDISPQRYELINELMKKNPKCKLFCVGDDWQSIMGFSGSNLDYFSNFSTYFKLGDGAKTDLTKNYRSTKTIVEAGKSIINNNKMKSSSNSNEKGQIPKETSAGNPNLMDKENPLLVFSVHESAFDKKYNETIAKHCLQRIKDLHEKDPKTYPYDEFLVLMRIKNEKKYIWEFVDKYSREFDIPIIKESHKEVPNRVRFMSVHKSKGLQAKVVIVLNMDKGQYGFPCELEQPDIFEPAIKNSDGMKEDEQEERRLFYVAVSRAKEEVIMYTQKNKESKFITEIKDFTKREELGY
jgi:DNA helicase-4